MKKLLLGASALVLGMTVASAANADCNGIYLGVRGGIVDYNYSKSSGTRLKELDKKKLMLAGAIGYRYNYWRTELEYVWRDKNKWHKSTGTGGGSRLSFESYSYMWNNYIDFAPYYWLSPYVGAGIGWTKMKFNSTSYNAFGEWDDNAWFNHTPTKFTWSLGGGLTVKVTNRFNVDAGYRYYDMGSIHKMDVHAHEIYGGVRYVF